MSFWDTVTDYAKTAVEFVTGTQTISPTVGPHGLSGKSGSGVSSYVGGLYGVAKGILGDDFISDAAGSFLKMGSPDNNTPQMQRAQYQPPKIERTSSTVDVASLAGMANPTGVNNARLQQALTSARARPNGSTPLQRMVGGGVSSTLRQGRRTQGLGTTNIARVAAAPAATVRKETTKI